LRSALIGGIGNILLGDDGVGPYVLRLLESQYEFGGDVELIDLGTPALDLTHQIVGLRSLILIDCVATDEPAGTVMLYRKEDILRIAPAERLDPHSPALSECLLAAELLGASPENVLLVGIVGASYEPGEPLSLPVRQAIAAAIDAVVEELRRLGYSVLKKETASSPEIWWDQMIAPEPLETGALR
jgi:hydrogenase maturation protease